MAVKRPRGMPWDYRFCHPREKRAVHRVGAEKVSEPIRKTTVHPCHPSHNWDAFQHACFAADTSLGFFVSVPSQIGHENRHVSCDGF